MVDGVEGDGLALQEEVEGRDLALEAVVGDVRPKGVAEVDYLNFKKQTAKVYFWKSFH